MTTQDIIAFSKVLTKGRFVSIKEIQKSPTKALNGFKIIVKNSDIQGIYMNISDWENFMEDMEVLAFDKYLKMIEESRNSKKFFSKEEIIKKYNLFV